MGGVPKSRSLITRWPRTRFNPVCASCAASASNGDCAAPVSVAAPNVGSPCPYSTRWPFVTPFESIGAVAYRRVGIRITLEYGAPGIHRYDFDPPLSGGKTRLLNMPLDTRRQGGNRWGGFGWE